MARRKSSFENKFAQQNPLAHRKAGCFRAGTRGGAKTESGRDCPAKIYAKLLNSHRHRDDSNPRQAARAGIEHQVPQL